MVAGGVTNLVVTNMLVTNMVSVGAGDAVNPANHGTNYLALGSGRITRTEPDKREDLQPELCLPRAWNCELVAGRWKSEGSDRDK